MLAPYSSTVKLLSGGKQIRGYSYVHVSLLKEQSKEIRDIVEAARKLAGLKTKNFNVVRFSYANAEIGYLNYPLFFEDPFPALTSSCVVDLTDKSVRQTDYSSRDNPPILHRKELLISDNHPSKPLFSALTAALEGRGLFKNIERIGLKKHWEKRLASFGLKIENHVVTEVIAAKRAVDANIEKVERHRTAIVRDRLSAPMQALARHGLLIPERDVLDYGCGQGDDVRALKAGGISAIGWDPHYAPEVKLAPADIVNLGFVLNVIEKPGERLQALRSAFELARQCLTVAVMVVGKGETSGYCAYGDGFLTRLGTFQKYWRQDEIKTFLDSALGLEAIAVAPGIFFIFRDKVLEQRFLLDRQRRIQLPLATEFRPPDRPQVIRSVPDQSMIAEKRLEVLRPLLERLWRQLIDMGRPVVEEEIDPEFLTEIQSEVGSLRRAERLASSQFDAQELIAAGNARREDLSVYFGLNLFNGRTRYSTLVPELQRDIKVLYGSAGNAFEAARALLFSVGKPDVIDEACRKASAAGLGYLVEGHSLQIHSSQINRLPAALRCYVGCATKLYGDIETADLVKIHIRSGKVSLLFYNDFDASPLPRLRERVKINMRTQRIDFFQYANEDELQLLYLKSRFMVADQPRYAQQKRFDDALMGLKLFDFSDYGPDADRFFGELNRARYQVRGYDLANIDAEVAR